MKNIVEISMLNFSCVFQQIFFNGIKALEFIKILTYCLKKTLKDVEEKFVSCPIGRQKSIGKSTCPKDCIH